MKVEAELIEVDKEITTIVEFDEFKLQLTEFKNKFKGIVYDFSDSEQEQAAKDDHKEIRKSYNALEVVRKAKKKHHQDAVTLIDSTAKEVKDEFDILCADIKAQQEDNAKIAILHAASLQKKVDDISNLGIFEELQEFTIDDLKARLGQVNGTVIDSSFELREADGHMAKSKTAELLEGKILVMEKRAAEQKEEAERQVQEQADREEQIRKDAAAKAEKEKEQAEAAAKKAEEDKKAAGIKAKKDAEIAKKKAEEDKKAAIKLEQAKAEKAAQEKETAARKEVERLQAIADKEAKVLKAKQENQEHRAKIHTVIKQALISGNLVSDDDHAIKIVKFIIESENVTINY